MNTIETSKAESNKDLMSRIAASPYIAHVMERSLRGEIEHPITDWHAEMAQHAQETFGPLKPSIVEGALLECEVGIISRKA